jgi:aminopeptidase-like protein
MEESVDTLVEIVRTADRGTEVYKCSVQYGSPMFSRCEEDIYASTMKLNNFNRGESHRRMLLELCNYSDGYLSLLEIAERNRRKVLDYLGLVDKLTQLGYLIKVRSI